MIMPTLEQLPQGINMSQLPELVKANPKYTKMLTGLGQIDAFVKKVVEETVANNADPAAYYIKTELINMAYSLQLFNIERQATVGYMWTLENLLMECQAKVVQSDIETITKRMIRKFGDTNLQTGDSVNWLT